MEYYESWLKEVVEDVHKRYKMSFYTQAVWFQLKDRNTLKTTNTDAIKKKSYQPL